MREDRPWLSVAVGIFSVKRFKVVIKALLAKPPAVCHYDKVFREIVATALRVLVRTE